MSRPDAAKWEAACKAKRRVFETMGVYEVVLRPKGRKVVGSEWVFRIKWGLDGKIQRYKARLVAQGFTQIEGIDYYETFAPVAKFASLRAILAIAAERNFEVHRWTLSPHTSTASWICNIQAPPPGFDIPEGMVLRLVKAVYGTKQGGRLWYEAIRDKLRSMGYTRTESDHAVFTCTHDGAFSTVALYVDDITMVSDRLESISQDKAALRDTYEKTKKPEMSRRREAQTKAQTSPLAWAVCMSCCKQRPTSTIDEAFLPLNWAVGTNS
jgi:hypothetical protein